MTWSVVSLRDERSWDPAALTAATLLWPGEVTRTTALGEIATPLLPDGWVEHDVPVITPVGLDPVSGGVRRRSRKYRGPAYQVHTSERGLRPGDLLVPMSPDLPVLVIRPEHVGSLVSSSFLALRPRDGLGLWIWGVLTSRTGRVIRSHLAANVLGRSSAKAGLLELQIPLPPLAEAGTVSERLALVEAQTHREEEEASETWWRTADLSLGEWSLALATPNPDVLYAGIPLGDLCGEITRGRPVPLELCREKPVPGHLPLTDIAVLGGKPVRRWVPLEPSEPIVAYSGDVFVAAVGARPHAVLATDITAVDRNVFVLRLRDRDHGPGLVHYLNGQTGYGLRQMLLTGGFIPNMRKDKLARLPVPPDALHMVGTGEPLVSLELQLEQALWG